MKFKTFVFLLALFLSGNGFCQNDTSQKKATVKVVKQKLHKCIVSFANILDEGYITKDSLLKVTKIELKGCNEDNHIISFELSTVIDNNAYIITSYSENVSKEMVAVLQKTVHGTKIFIENIKYISPEKKTTQIPLITVNIR